MIEGIVYIKTFFVGVLVIYGGWTCRVEGGFEEGNSMWKIFVCVI